MTGLNRPSLYEERAATSEGKLGLAAAGLASKVMSVLWAAKEQSGMTSRQLADFLKITEGRVSQVLHGDGNVHIATLARFLRAMGFRLEVRIVPADSDPVARRRPRRRSASSETAASRFDIYEQMFLTSDGVQRVRMWIPSNDLLGSVPEGRPVLTGHSMATIHRRPYSSRQKMKKVGWELVEAERG
jgi:transcriptional regulator with XRE-family HTH domain